MQKILYLITLGLFLASCDGFGTKKVKSITELASKSVVTSTESVMLNDNAQYKLDIEKLLQKHNNCQLTKNSLIAPPIFVKGKIYSIDNKGIVSAFSVKEKKMLWQQTTANNVYDPNYLGGGISFDHDKLYITNGSRYLIILDSATGYEIFRKEFSDIIRTKPIILSSNKILVQTISNQVLLYDVANAKTLLVHEVLTENMSSANHINPMIYDSKILITYNTGLIAALNLYSGNTEWELNLGDIDVQSDIEDNIVSASPVIDKGQIYIANNIQVFKVDLSNGNIVWSSKIDSIQSMNIQGNSLFVTTAAKQVAAISLANGEVKWVADLDDHTKKRNNKPTIFLAPFMFEDKQNRKSLIILDAKGIIYSFDYHNDALNSIPTISKLSQNILYYGNSCCGQMYLITDRSVMLLK